MARKLVVEIIGDASSLEKSFKQAQGKTDTFGGSIKRVGKIAAFTAGGAALGGLALVLKRSVETANEHAKVYAQTNAVLKSTGGAAKVSAKQVATFADATEKLTGIDDVAIQKGENMLLTFTNIRNGVGKNNKIFTEASKVLVDMTTALGSDPQKQAIQLGKALNDPVKGVSALARVGVTFTEGQKDTIKQLVKTGQRTKAQRIILKELNKEFGGSAKAFGRTLPGQMKIFQARLDDILQTIGQKLIPVLTKALDVLGDLLSIFQGSGSASDKFRKALERLGVSAKTSKRIIDDVKETVHAFQVVFTKAFEIMRPIMDAFFKQVQAWFKFFDDLVHGRWAKALADLGGIFKATFNLMKTILVTAIKVWGGLALRIGRAIKNKIVEGLKGLGSGILAAITRGLGGLWGFLERLIIAPVNKLIDLLNKIPGVDIKKIGEGGGGGGGTKPIGGRGGAVNPNQPIRPGLGPTNPVTGPPIFTRPRTTQGVTGAAVTGNVVLNGPVTVVANNPQEFITGMQKWARRQSASRSGRFGGINLGAT